MIKDPPFEAQDTLRAWQEKNHPWLELSDVHKETTENIRVTVIPFYMGYRENQNTNVYWVSDICISVLKYLEINCEFYLELLLYTNYTN